MSTQPAFLFAVKPEQYATLTIESLFSPTAPTITPPNRQLDQPPLKQAIADPQAGGQFDHSWKYWINKLYQFVQTGDSPSGSLVEFVAPSVDETDIKWWGLGTIDSSTDPVTFTATLTGKSRFGITATVELVGQHYTTATAVIKDANGDTHGAAMMLTIDAGRIVRADVTSDGWGLVPPLSVTITGDGTGAQVRAIVGRQFSVGDWIVWNHEYHYEIDQITNLVWTDASTVAITLQRAAKGAPAGTAQFLSPLTAHTSKLFWRLVPGVFTTLLDPDIASPQVRKFLWDNMTVCAVQGSYAGQPALTQNFGPLVTGTDRNSPPCPGMRTMSGSAYISFGINGDLTIGALTNVCLAGQAWESLRCVYASVETAPAGSDITIYVGFFDPDGVLGLVDILVIPDGGKVSYSSMNRPDGRQMPYFLNSRGPVSDIGTLWPPEFLPQISSGLVVPIVVNPLKTVLWQPDGKLQAIVTTIGSGTAGADLNISVQT